MRVVLLLLLLSTPALAQLGPGNPPPGANDFRAMHGRASWVRDAVLKIAPGANGRCIYAVALEIVGYMEAAWSDDVEGRGKAQRTVRKREMADFKRALHENAKAECGGGPGGSDGQYETTKGLLEFAADPKDWTTDNYERLQVDVIKAAQGLAALGVLVPPVAMTTTASSVLLPILNPEYFMRREDDGPPRL